MDFIVKVTMDKNEMKHPRNVARALERIARDLDERFALNAVAEPAKGVIRDVSGSVVGGWELSSSTAT